MFFVCVPALYNYNEVNKEIAVFFSLAGKHMNDINVKLESDPCFNELRFLLVLSFYPFSNCYYIFGVLDSLTKNEYWLSFEAKM